MKTKSSSSQETTMSERVKKKQGPKPGKVIRVSDGLIHFIERAKLSGETNDLVLRKLLGLPNSGEIDGEVKEYYVLPGDLHENVADARGRAIIQNVKLKKKIEEPIIVRRTENDE